MKRRLLVGAIVLFVALLVGWRLVAETQSSSPPVAGDATVPATEKPRAVAPRRKREDPPPQTPTEDPYAEFRRYVADRRAAGKPTTLAELLGPDPPDAENAAVEVSAALAAVTAELGNEETWPQIGPWWGTSSTRLEDETPERLAELLAFLDRLAPYCERIAAALDRPRCRFRPGAIGEEYLAILDLQHVQRMLSAVAAASRDEARREQAIRTMLRLARQNEPARSISVMVNSALGGGAVSAIRSGLEHNQLDAAAVRSRLDPLLRTDWIGVGPRFFEMQLVFSLSMAEAWIDGELPAVARKDLELPPAEGLVGGLALVDEAARLVPGSFGPYLKACQEIGERAHAARLPDGMGSMFVRHLGRIEAATRLARIALATAEHRARTGDFPATLDDLKRASPDGVPLDPYTDAPFIYAKTATGVRLASVGHLADGELLDEETLRERLLVWELTR